MVRSYRSRARSKLPRICSVYASLNRESTGRVLPASTTMRTSELGVVRGGSADGAETAAGRAATEAEYCVRGKTGSADGGRPLVVAVREVGWRLISKRRSRLDGDRGVRGDTAGGGSTE